MMARSTVVLGRRTGSMVDRFLVAQPAHSNQKLVLLRPVEHSVMAMLMGAELGSRLRYTFPD